MVDAVVSYAVQKLGDFLIEKAESQRKIGKDVEWLRKELQYMQSFLKDAEQKHTMDHLVREWVSEIIDLAHDAVDTLHECNGEASKNRIADRVKRYVCICKKEDIGTKIELLKIRVLDLSRRRETYGITEINKVGEGANRNSQLNGIATREWRRTNSYVEEEHFVGLEDVTNMLLKELLKDKDCRSVISIHGMGGLGKTTLAQMLYNSIHVKNRFTCRAWICVSQEYSIQDLLRTVIKSFKRGCTREEIEMIEKMRVEDLEHYLREFLKERRYLVVLDDVWRKEDWERLKRAFPDRCRGSRVIITTRIEEVAERVDGISFVHHLRFLTHEESWDLFRKKIYGRDEHSHHFSPEQHGIGEEMVRKCGGLPLAVVVLGGLLSYKKSVEQWCKVKDQLWWHMKNDSIDISRLLFLSYNDLPSELKQCFLYVGIFPEDKVIEANKLIRLWIAEEFIPRGNIMEDTAEDYLHELINRSLIQVAGRSWEKIIICKIHDLLRDLAVEKAKEAKLFDIYDSQVHASAHSSQRRLTFHTEIEKLSSLDISGKKLRSILFFNSNPKEVITENLMTICEKFKWLCVIDLDLGMGLSLGSGPFLNIPYNARPLPDAIGDVIHLKFLSLIYRFQVRTDPVFSQLPSTIGNLKSLQSLEIAINGPYSLPVEISKLINLRHLIVHNSVMDLKISTLTNLRTLKKVSYSQWINIDTINLVNLRELLVENVAPIKDKSYSLDSLSNLKNLTTLNLYSTEGMYSYLPSLEPLFSCPCLRRLHPCGKIEFLPSFDKFPQSLTNLMLDNSELSEDPMPTLEKLLNLRTLEIIERAYVGKEISCSDDGFRQLEHLVLDDLPNLEKWRLADTSMPVIKSLKIVNCPKLKIVPKRLKSISE